MIRFGSSHRHVNRIALFATLAAALLIRLPGIEWGLPPATPQVRASDFRSSYAFDEDDILSGAAKASVARLDFDPYEYHWGTLHSELVLLALDGTQAAGAFHAPWRQAYYNLLGDDFIRVYVVGRLVAVAAALFTVWLLFQFPSPFAGMFAAMLIAVSPSHLLQSDQVRVDVTMTAMLVLTVLVALRTQQDPRWRQFLTLGFAAGLAMAAKYSAVTAVAAIAIAALVLQRFPWRGALAVVGGAAAGFVAGGPYIVIKPRAFYDEINRYLTGNQHVPVEFQIAPARLFELHTINLIRFSMGPVAFLLAAAGLWWMLRRRSPADWIVAAAMAGYAVILLPLRWPLIRYDLPLTVLLGIAAGVALERLPTRWRNPIAAAALVMPLAGCLAQIHYMRSPHPVNIMLPRILDTVPSGTPISRLLPEAPPLDLRVYPMGPDLFMDDLAKNPPGWVLTSNLPDQPFKASNVALLRSAYQEVAHSDSQRILAWATLGESAAPHDWKYTHCSQTLYRKKAP